MDADLKKILKAVVLEMRHELEGYYDNAGKWFPGDLEQRLAEIGVRKDRESAPADELALADEDVAARKIIDAYISLRQQAGVNRADAVAEYVRESAYTWANRLVALRCMEARELLDDEVIVGREAYGGRSLVHHRLAQTAPELCTGEDDGRFAMLFGVFAERAETLPMLFDPESPSIALRPSPPALNRCFTLLNLGGKGLGARVQRLVAEFREGLEAWDQSKRLEARVQGLGSTTSPQSLDPSPTFPNPFLPPDALGWAYQYWNTEEKDRVFETVRTKKGAKIEGADIIPATQLYTEDYMVKFLVQNSLGATWMGMHPDSKLSEGLGEQGLGARDEGPGNTSSPQSLNPSPSGWEYYVKDADRAPAKLKSLNQITLLDPACGSGHFLIEAFDMFYDMYEEAARNGWPTGLEPQNVRENKHGQQLSRSSRLAKVDGDGSGGLRGVPSVSEGRAIRTDEPSQTRGGVDSVEHSGGACERVDEGVSTSPLVRTGITSRSGNPNDPSERPGIHNSSDPSNADHLHNGNRQDASGPPEIFEDEGLGKKGLGKKGLGKKGLGKKGLGKKGLGARDQAQELSSSSPCPLSPSPSLPPYSLDPSDICRAILENNLFGIDIDERAIQIAEASLWMKAEEKAFGFKGATTNLVAATSSHLKGESWERYLAKLKKEPSTVRVLRKFAVEMEHIDELGSLARPAEALESIIKQEHELWENQERERHEADKSLFKEIRDDVLASQLPFQDITDQKFFKRTMQHALFAIDGFTAEARATGEFDDQLMGVEAKTGFRLLDLLSRKYDVVVANPPYMGSKNMGPVLKDYVGSNFKAGKRDIYAAFILRCLSLCRQDSRTAMVTRDAWLFQTEYANLRYREPEENEEITGLIAENHIEIMAHLGPGAFNEISGEVVSVALFVLSTCTPAHDSFVVGIRTTGDSDLENKDRDLRLASKQTTRSSRNRIRQSTFCQIPTAPLLYWLRGGLLDAFISPESRVGELAHVCAGLSTGANPRFVRGQWECSETERWVPYEKGGGLCKWWGLRLWSVDWEHGGKRLRWFPGSAIRAEQYYFRDGLTYTGMAQGSLGARILVGDGIFAVNSSSGVFPNDGVCAKRLCAMLSSNFASYLLRCVIPKPQISEDYLSRLPLPLDLPLHVVDLVDYCIAIKRRLIEHRPVERDFTPAHLLEREIGEIAISELRNQACLHLIEGYINREVNKSGGLDSESIDEICNETGVPVGWLPMFDASDLDFAINDFPDEIAGRITEFVQCLQVVSKAESSNLDRRVHDCFCKTNVEEESEKVDESNSDDDDDQDGTVRKLIPAETLLERIARDCGANPISVFKIIENGYLNQSWRCSSQEYRICCDQLSTMIMALLGHRWNQQTKNCVSLAENGDDDGIVPLTDVAKESKIQERLAMTCQGDNFSKADFANILGKPLSDWLSFDFFDHHNKQFKKRPIAWQIQSSRFTSRMTPAFACLVYYHRVNADVVAKIRSQYTGPLKVRFETEMRGISTTPAANRTDKQAKRAVELEEAITELQAFDERLATIAKSGFGPAKLLPTLRQYAFDDAMLAMKARWLKRLSELLAQSPGEEAADGTRAASPLDQWQVQAIDTGLHRELAEWIGEALSNLDYFCSQVGPKAPEAKRTPDDPTAADFAELIRTETATMQTRSIELACGVWWGKFDAAVLAPIKERIKTLKAEQKELNAAIKEDRQPVLDADTNATVPTGDTPLLSNDEPSEQTTELTKAAMKARLKEVKAKIKKFTDEMNLKAGKAQAIRDAIQAWNSSEPDQWQDWLAEGPMFDQVASLDDRRTHPKTIAEFIDQESLYAPDINDGVRVNIAPLQKAGVLAADVLAAKDLDKAIADRAEWRADERRWVREGKLPQCGWWAEVNAASENVVSKKSPATARYIAPEVSRPPAGDAVTYAYAVLSATLLEQPDGIELIDLARVYCLLASPGEIRSALSNGTAGVSQTDADVWRNGFNESIRLEMFTATLEDMVSRKLAGVSGAMLIPGERLSDFEDAWASYDAAFVVSALRSMPEAIREQIVEPSMQEEVFALRLVG